MRNYTQLVIFPRSKQLTRIIVLGTPSTATSPQPSADADDEADLIDLNGGSNNQTTPPDTHGNLGPVRSQRGSLSRSVSVTPVPNSVSQLRGSKRSRTDADFESSVPSSPYPKRRAGLEGADYGSLRRPRALIDEDDGDDVGPSARRKLRRRVSPMPLFPPETKRKASGESRGLAPLRELLASADDDD